MVMCTVMLMRLIDCRHAQHSKEAVKDCALIEVCIAGSA